MQNESFMDYLKEFAIEEKTEKTKKSLNREKLHAIKDGINLRELESTTHPNLNDSDFTHLSEIAGICFGNIKALKNVLQNRMNVNIYKTTDSAIFCSVLNEFQMKKLKLILDEETFFKLSTEIDVMPLLKKETIEEVIVSFQSEYFNSLSEEI